MTRFKNEENQEIKKKNFLKLSGKLIAAELLSVVLLLKPSC